MVEEKKTNVREMIRNLTGKNMLIFLLNCCIYISYLLPICSISHDNQFGNIKWGLTERRSKKLKENLRFSIVKLYLGSFYFHLFTFPINPVHSKKNGKETKDKFSIGKRIFIKEAVEKNEHKLLGEDYEPKIKEKNEDEIVKVKELAQYYFERTQRNLSNTQNKINNLLAVVLVMLPLVVTIWGSKFNQQFPLLNDIEKNIFIVFSVFLCYFIVCLIFLLSKNFSKESIEVVKIDLFKEGNDFDITEIYLVDNDFQRILSMERTTALKEIFKCIVLLLICFLATIII